MQYLAGLLPFEMSSSVAADLLANCSNLSRPGLLKTPLRLLPAIEAHEDRAGLMEITRAVQDTSRWFS
jgi:hypothetical protein